MDAWIQSPNQLISYPAQYGERGEVNRIRNPFWAEGRITHMFQFFRRSQGAYAPTTTTTGKKKF